MSDGVELGDWLIWGGSRGVENAPVDWRRRLSKRSCSAFGRRGGEGPVRKGRVESVLGSLGEEEEEDWWREVVERRWRLKVKMERFGVLDLDLRMRRWERRGVSGIGMIDLVWWCCRSRR